MDTIEHWRYTMDPGYSYSLLWMDRRPLPLGSCSVTAEPRHDCATAIFPAINRIRPIKTESVA